jgi:hypothetical protein
MHVITDESIFVHNFMVHKKKPNKTKVGVILFIDSTNNEHRKSKVARPNNTNIDLTCIINKTAIL